MTESFLDSQRIMGAEMASLVKRSNYPAWIRGTLLFMLFLLTSFACIVTWQGPWGLAVISQIFFGLVGCSMFACEHECIHNTAFRSRFLNQAFAFLAGIAHLYPSALFRELHFTHHRYTHVPGKDPEISLGSKPALSVLSNLPIYLSWMTGILLLLFKVGMVVMAAVGMPEAVRLKLYPFVNPEKRLAIAFESALVIFVYAAVVVLAVNVNSGWWSLLVGQVVAHGFLSFFVTAEHNGLPHEGNVLERTRSTQTNIFTKLLMWNMPYHAEHHAYPAVPFHRLPQLHDRLKPDLKNVQDGYAAFHAGIVKKLTGG